MDEETKLITSLAQRLWAQKGQLVNWEHLGADVRGYDTTVSALSRLLGLGFDVRLSPAGVRLVPPEDTPCTDGLLDEHSTPIVYFAMTESTNSLASNLARVGATHGTIVVAEAQLEGRGRYGHDWFSPAGMGLWFSMIFRPTAPVDRPGLVPILIGVSLGRVIRSLGARSTLLKWTNDLLWRNKKLAGILVERIQAGPREAFVVGIGINVHQTGTDFPDELRSKSIGLDQVLGKTIHRGELLQLVVPQLHALWDESFNSSFDTVSKLWNEESGTIGMNVRAAVESEIIPGVIEGIDSHGGLVLRLPDDSRRTIITGRIEIMGSGTEQAL